MQSCIWMSPYWCVCATRFELSQQHDSDDNFHDVSDGGLATTTTTTTTKTSSTIHDETRRLIMFYICIFVCFNGLCWFLSDLDMENDRCLWRNAFFPLNVHFHTIDATLGNFPICYVFSLLSALIYPKLFRFPYIYLEHFISIKNIFFF